MTDTPWTAAAEDPDADLVRRVALGDAAACAALVDRWLSRVHGTAARLLGNPADASEVAQDVFLRLWSQAHTWRPERGRFSTWLYRIVVNVAQDRRRRRRSDVPLDAVPLPAGEGNPESVAVAREREHRLHQALAALPERQREALVLFHYEGLPQAEAAAAMGISADALESLLARGRRALREQLRDTA